MFFKKSMAARWLAAIAISVFICVTRCSSGYGKDFSLPLPADAQEVTRDDSSIGPTKSEFVVYETALSQPAAERFFRKELASDGWFEKQHFSFTRGGKEVLVISFIPSGKVLKFGVMYTLLPSELEITAAVKEKPDKVDFMPLYANARQLYLWDAPMGKTAAYQTQNHIKEVTFFYKSVMPNYGWFLSNEIPLTKSTDSDCPECAERFKSLPSAESTGVEKFMQREFYKTKLFFKRDNGESCIISIMEQEQIKPVQGKETVADYMPADQKYGTNISVTYINKKL